MWLQTVVPERVSAGHEHLPVSLDIGCFAFLESAGHEIAIPAILKLVQLPLGLILQLRIDGNQVHRGLVQLCFLLRRVLHLDPLPLLGHVLVLLLDILDVV